MMGLVLFLVAVAAFYIYIYRPWSYMKKFTFKVVGIYLLLGVTALMVYAAVWTVSEVRETEQEKMLSSRLSRAQNAEQRGDYAGLANNLSWDKDYEEEFAYLWERLMMYTGSDRYLIFEAAADAGLGEVYEERAVFYKELLHNLCTNPKYDSNIPYGKYYLEKAGLNTSQ